MKKNEYKDILGTLFNVDTSLRKKYIEPPLSVLNSRSGYWQRRKQKWKNIGIKSEIGRSVAVFATMHKWAAEKKLKGLAQNQKGQSIFDSVLTELMYNWFCPDNGRILDPFAGGSVRGIVAHYLDYKYVGVDLSQKQIDCNRDQASDILHITNQPNWYVGDSDKILNSGWEAIGKNKELFDFIFSCPPYMNLEVYSKHEDDLSNMGDNQFISKYESIINKSCALLKKDSFACFVISDIRDKKTGFYKDFIGITKNAFYKAGLRLYNSLILVNQVGNACIRCEKAFLSSKKITSVHQNILIFKKI